MNLTDRAYVASLLGKYGLAPKKSRGQNFLANASVVRNIAGLCGDGDLCVLEIGPGVGALTAELCALYKKVVAVEVDTGLIPVLGEVLGGFSNAEVICADIMKVDIPALIGEKFAGERVCVCANLPYYITSPVIMKLLEFSECFESITVMVQKEVADRFCASPATGDYGAITLSVRYKAEVKKCFSVAPGNFIPPPSVTSSVIKMTMRKSPPVKPISEENMFYLIRLAFGQRRKTLSNALSGATQKYTKEEIEAAILSLGLPAGVRGECLGLEEFAALSDMIMLK